MDILKEIGQPAMLEQLAEECAELGQAALKLARVMRGENPTPKTQMQCLDALTEEIADVELVIDQLGEMVDTSRVEAVKDQKWVRWQHRIEMKWGEIDDT